MAGAGAGAGWSGREEGFGGGAWRRMRALEEDWKRRGRLHPGCVDG